MQALSNTPRWRLGGLAAAAVSLAFGTLALPAHAEDIDLYSASSTTGPAPNVLFLLDNTSNWSASNQAWNKASVLAKCGTDTTCTGYVNTIFGTATSLTQGQVELRTLALVINNLVCNSPKPLNLNIGLMLLSATKGSYPNDDSSWVGGWFVQAVSQSKTYCSNAPGSMLSQMSTIDANITGTAYKAASNANYGDAMFEVFKYFGGYNNPAGAQSNTPQPSSLSGPTGFGQQRYTAAYSFEDPNAFSDKALSTYKSPITDACQRNYLVIVGNTFPNLEEESVNPKPVWDRMLKNLKYTNGYQQLASSLPANKYRYADEWAYFLANGDVSSQPGIQSVNTYAIDVFNTQPDSNQGALLQSIANYGGSGSGSGYFSVGGNLSQLMTAFSDIFVQISATSSVFASASLPVSVNTQGTYLNQVFVGMFRPDGLARPRWAGNLKQYQFAYTGGSLYLADKDGLPAINNTGTGFIDSCRSSFWTTDTSSMVNGAGYWANIGTTPQSACPTLPTGILPTSDLPDGDIVEKGSTAEVTRLKSPTSRVIKTCTDLTCGTVADLSLTNLTTLSTSLSLTTPSLALANWIQGLNSGDGPVDNQGNYQYYSMAQTVTRPTVHGDVVHSRPLAINYGKTGGTDDVVVYYGAGDGLFRAIDGNQTLVNGSTPGSELWSFFAPEFLSRMSRLRDDSPLISYPSLSNGTITPTPQPKDYFFDGAVGAYQERDSTGAVSKVWLFPSMRRGGREIYAFNATTRPQPGTSSSYPSFMWKFGCPNLTNDTGCTSGATGIGQTWSTPKPIRVLGDSKVYLVFGGGYDNCEDSNTCGSSTKGHGIYVLDASSGNLVASIDLSTIVTDAGRVVADVVPVDVNGDGYTDLLYVVDTRGYVWRINVSDPLASTPYTGYSPSNWATRTYLIAKVSDWTQTAQSRKFEYSPDVVVLGGTANVFVGTGDREKPLYGSTATQVNNKFYSFRDNYAVGASGSSSGPTTINGRDCDASGDTVLDSGCDLLNVTTTGLNYSTTLQSTLVRGWVLDLTSTAVPYEQVVTSPVTAGGYVYFSTYQASSTDNAGSCTNLGNARGYAVDFLDGSVRPGDSGRSAIFTGGGLPPSPVAGVVQINGVKVPFILGGRPTGSNAGSVLEGSKVPINVQQIRKKIYRYRKIDN